MEEKTEKTEKTDENSGHNVIANDRPNDDRWNTARSCQQNQNRHYFETQDESSRRTSLEGKK